jgi:hypothetical protein
MSVDLTHGINMHQDVKAIVKDYENKVAREEAKDHDPDDVGHLPKEEIPFNTEAERYVQRGRLNPENGMPIPLTDKARTVASWIPSKAFLDRYDQIKWED